MFGNPQQSPNSCGGGAAGDRRARTRRHNRRAGLVRRVSALLASGATAACLGCGCGGKVSPPVTAPMPAGPVRGFQLGMTPFPAEVDINSFVEAVTFAGTHGDFISNHHDDGVPWDSMLAGADPDPSQVSNFAYRRDRGIQMGVKNYVSLTFLNQDRDSIAWGLGQTPWPAAVAANPTFANPVVRYAIKRWCAWMTRFYQPDWLSAGIEVNFYAARHPADWPNLVSLYREVYDTLKTIRPGMAVYPTFQLETMRGNNQWGLVASFEDKMDAMALSMYPGSGLQTPANLPADYLSMARTATGTAKPLVISETGYGDSTLVPFPGSPDLQRDYLMWVVDQADSLDIQRITWFFPSNIWAIWEAAPAAQKPIIRFFAPMGLRTRTLASKPVLDVWETARARPYAP
jgi:hypothetical protein